MYVTALLGFNLIFFLIVCHFRDQAKECGGTCCCLKMFALTQKLEPPHWLSEKNNRAVEHLSAASSALQDKGGVFLKHWRVPE